MTIWHGEKGRKSTGGKITAHRKKRKYELGGPPTYASIGKEHRRIVRTKGAGFKVKAASVEFANVLDKKTKTVKKAKILSILKNSANQHFVRRGLITKGAIVKTEVGNARITSRPSQHGIVNAVMVEDNLNK